MTLTTYTLADGTLIEINKDQIAYKVPAKATTDFSLWMSNGRRIDIKKEGE